MELVTRAYRRIFSRGHILSPKDVAVYIRMVTFDKLQLNVIIALKVKKIYKVYPH